uniref:Uncharacterized protein n=1 Tax=Aegilops tauschii subsp. strangulata TaxID=200361 RepID=A0A452ZM90_AEGTS
RLLSPPCRTRHAPHSTAIGRDDPRRPPRAEPEPPMMGDDKAPRSLSPMGGRDRDRELLIPVSGGGGGGSVPRAGEDDDDLDRTAASPSASAALSSTGREVRPPPFTPRSFP